MCQLCDEADAYLAQLEAAAKKRAEEQEAEAGGRDEKRRRQEDRAQEARVLDC